MRRGSTDVNLLHFEYPGDRFALIGTPGAAGFAADGLGALLGVDLAVVAVDAA